MRSDEYNKSLVQTKANGNSPLRSDWLGHCAGSNKRDLWLWKTDKMKGSSRTKKSYEWRNGRASDE